MKNLTYIADKIYLTDKGTVGGASHRFTENYNDAFEKIYNIAKYENRKVNILEIGVLHGNSLLMLNDFFGGACNIIGFDVEDGLIDKFNENHGGGNMKVLKCDQGNINDLEKFVHEYYNMKFDIIIDDGSHVYQHQMISLYILSRMLNNNGIYILEDLHTSLYLDGPVYGDNSDKTTTPLYSLVFRAYSPYLTEEQNADLFGRLGDVVVFNNKNYNIPNYTNSSVTSILKFNN